MNALIVTSITIILLYLNPCHAESDTNSTMLNHVQKATFQWFLAHSDPKTGLIADRSGSTKAPASIAGTGFGLVAYAIAADRGWISRTKAATYTLKVLKGLYNSPQGQDKEGNSGYMGFFYHYLDPHTGLRASPPKYWYSELSSIDTALLMAGVLFTRNYYHKTHPLEDAIRSLSTALYERVNWPWLLTEELTISHGYTPENGRIPYAYKGYNEAMILYILAISSNQHPIPAQSWNAYLGDAKAEPPAPDELPMLLVSGMPLFTYQYTQAFIPFKGIQDEVNQRYGFDYFTNSQRATLAQWHYAQNNESGKRGYNHLNWGLTASDGPADITKKYEDQEITFHTYRERGAPNGFDDGTIAPTAAISSIVFTPSIVIKTMNYWLTHRPELFNQYGFADAFNPSFDTSTFSGWVDTDRLSIDQGPILLMIENYRTKLIWNTMKQDKQIKQGLIKAGFKGDWLQNE